MLSLFCKKNLYITGGGDSCSKIKVSCGPLDNQADLFDKVSVTGLFGKAIILCHPSTM